MFTDPVKNLKAFGLREDNIVADLGAGTGYYTLAASPMVSRGKIYAVEITRDFLTTIKNKVTEAHLNNVDILWGNVEVLGGTHIGDAVVDAVIASNVLFQVEDKNKFIDEIKRILKPNGRVLVIDWSVDSEEGKSGEPSSPIPLKGAIPKTVAEEMFARKGFMKERDIDAGAHHYGMILVKSNE